MHPSMFHIHNISNCKNIHKTTQPLSLTTMVVTTVDFRRWLKSNPNMKLNSDVAVLRIIAEGITSYESLADFDEKSDQNLATVCREYSSHCCWPSKWNLCRGISIRRLIVANNDVIYYRSIDKTLTLFRLNYINFLSGFKVDWQAYQDLRKLDEPKVPKVVDNHNERKVIKWVPIF